MDGNFKLITTLILLLAFSSCKKNESIRNRDGSEIIKYNMSVLLDSLEYFDWTRIPVSKKFNDVEKKQFKIELIDSILWEENISETCNVKFNNQFKNNSKLVFQSFKLDNSFIQNNNFKNIGLVKKSSNDIYILSIIFSNLLVSENRKYACVVVTKKVGISMQKDIYFFENKNNEWNYIRRENISIG
jgi:hypothetical protein